MSVTLETAVLRFNSKLKKKLKKEKTDQKKLNII